MKLSEILEEMTEYQHKLEVYALLERTLTEYLHSDSEAASCLQLAAQGCLDTLVSQEAIDSVLCEVHQLKDKTENGLSVLQNIRVDYGEDNESEEEKEEDA